MIVPSLDGRKPTMDDVKRAADEYNKMGEQSPRLVSSRAFIMRVLSFSMVDGSGPMTCCWTFSIRSWSGSSSRSPQSAAATTPRSISRSTLAASFQCTYRLVGGSQKNHAGWTGHSGLEENLCRGENGGVKNYFVEMNLEMMKASVPYLHALQV